MGKEKLFSPLFNPKEFSVFHHVYIPKYFNFILRAEIPFWVFWLNWNS